VYSFYFFDQGLLGLYKVSGVLAARQVGFQGKLAFFSFWAKTYFWW